MHETANVLKVISSPVPSGDTAKIFETEFTAPPLLQRLGDLLSIVKEGSPNYKLPSENCYFFCAVIYEILSSIGKGKIVTGIPGKFSLSRARKAKAKIKKRMATWPLVCSSPLYLQMSLLTVPSS
ncbi:hypothetical protein BS47DRAFT_486967 [Hydnum rufescens UP504]|uniref:Uncharacterized protein n=1 Tax=Hydnum rufescens UP504 TaxID=1448309 RepID=A0A9P6AHC4_9AGAM|nr:hypothetical protein BS47DRAFT_486967 [Hydnum rufescens UP504]